MRELLHCLSLFRACWLLTQATPAVTRKRLLLLVAALDERPGQKLRPRHLEWIEECKDAVQTLRLIIKKAKAHRGQCCSVLAAALTAALALEQAMHSCALNTAKAQELQRLYAAVIAAIELAQQRVQVRQAHLC